MVDLPEIPSDVTADELKKAEAEAASRETAVADACPTCGDVTKSECAKKIDDIQRETDAINDISDPIDRNKAITKAYTELAEQDTENRWIKLASIVSAQRGCAMKDVKTMPEMLPAKTICTMHWEMPTRRSSATSIRWQPTALATAMRT